MRNESAIDIKEFVQYVSFNIFSMLSLSIYILIDTYFVADKLGIQGLAALNLAIPFFSFMGGLGLLLGVGGGINYTIEREKASQYKANQVFTESLKMGLVISAIFVLIGVFLTESIVALFDVEMQTAEYAITYIRWMLVFSPAFIFNHITSSFVKNDGNPQLTMIALVIGSVVNATFDYIFMYIFDMGMLGAIVATIMSPMTSLAISLLHFRSGELKVVKESLDFADRFQILESGVPILINDISRGIMVMLFNVLALRFAGDTGIASYGIIANLSVFLLSIYTGIGQGVQPLASKFYAEENGEALKTLLKYGFIISVVYFVISYAGVFFGAEWITDIFNSESSAEMAQMAPVGLRIYFSGALFAGLNVIMSLFFASIRMSKIAMTITILKGVVLITITAYALSYIMGITGLWLSYPVTEFLVLIFALYSYKKLFLDDLSWV